MQNSFTSGACRVHSAARGRGRTILPGPHAKDAASACASALAPRALRFELLGPLALKVGDVDFAPTAPRLRAVLSLLVLNANRVVPTSVFLDELWDGATPPSARGTLQTYVFHLRKLFEQALGESSKHVMREVLVTHMDGYLIRVGEGQFDVHDFECLVDQGAFELAAGDVEEASGTLRRALDLWRGPISVDWSTGTKARAHAARLDELHYRALLMFLEANLCAGRHREVVGELASLQVEEPSQQTVHAMFMIALHRSDRTSGALSVFRRLAERMREDLGLRPSGRLQSLHRALLAEDPLLDDRRLRIEPLLDQLAAKW
jgi:DNA-binding SARP family transcriptional activator